MDEAKGRASELPDDLMKRVRQLADGSQSRRRPQRRSTLDPPQSLAQRLVASVDVSRVDDAVSLISARTLPGPPAG